MCINTGLADADSLRLLFIYTFIFVFLIYSKPLPLIQLDVLHLNVGLLHVWLYLAFPLAFFWVSLISPLSLFPGVCVTLGDLSHSHTNADTKQQDQRVAPVSPHGPPTPVFLKNRPTTHSSIPLMQLHPQMRSDRVSMAAWQMWQSDEEQQHHRMLEGFPLSVCWWG